MLVPIGWATSWTASPATSAGCGPVDARKQTFADKIMGTVVVNASQVQPPV
jgi:hypothetical protein